jgi:hypothetical protein
VVEPPPAAAADPGGSHQVDAHHPMSRRGALLTLGGVAAGGVGLAVGSAFLTAEPAAAIMPINPNFILDQNNTGTANTELSGGVAAPMLSVENTSAAPGIYGVSDGTSGIFSTTAFACGVLGDNNSGSIGVVGVSGGGNDAVGVFGVGGGNPEIPPLVTPATIGVFGATNTTAGIGVFGASSGGDGVQGLTKGQSHSGVLGIDSGTQGGFGVKAQSANGYGVHTQGGLAPLRLVPAGTDGPPTAGAHVVGEVYVDTTGAVFVCTAAGTPGTWKEISASAPQYNNNNAGITGSLGLAGSVNLLTSPIRVFDSRVADSPAAPSRPKGQVLANSTTQLQIAGVTVGGLSVPDGAVAVVGNVTAAVPAAIGFLTLFPAGGTTPATSNLNYSAGVNVANYCVVVLNAAGQMDIFSQSQTDVIFDVTGFIF